MTFSLSPVLTALAIPLAVLTVSYVLLVREFGTWRLWHVKIHESGRRTLRETVFYYNHFLRELPIDTLYAAAIVNSYSAAGVRVWERLQSSTAAPVGLALLLVWVLVGSVRSVGLRSTLADLSQSHETDTRAGWGSHWQMHFLSTAAVLLVLLLPAAIFDTAGGFALRAVPLMAAFVLLSLLFGCGVKALTDKRWILHGAREVITYAIMIGLPFLLPLLVSPLAHGIRVGPASIVIIACLLLIAVYMTVVRLRSDLNAEASSPRGVLFLLSSHFFEHVLDYAYIFLVVLSLMAWQTV